MNLMLDTLRGFTCRQHCFLLALLFPSHVLVLLWVPFAGVCHRHGRDQQRVRIDRRDHECEQCELRSRMTPFTTSSMVYLSIVERGE